MISKLFQSIQSIAKDDPERTAIICDLSTWTFRDLCGAIRKAQKNLEHFQLSKGDFVGIHLDNSFEAYAYIYASLALGLTYVPLSPNEPLARLHSIIRNSGIELLIGKNLSTLKLDTDIEVLDLAQQTAETSGDAEIRFPTSQTEATSGIYLMHTSGTTGSPKGILIAESNLENFCNWALEYFSITANDVFLGHIHLTFDLSVFHLFVPFLAGASVRITPPTLERIAPGRQLQQGVTIAMLVPRMTGLLAGAGFLQIGNFPAMRHLLFCGEKLFAQQISLWQKCQPNLTIHNLYGPTEATVACTCFTIQPGQSPVDPVPMGRAISGMQLSIRDDKKVGELLIAGPQVTPFEYFGALNSKPVPRKSSVYATGDLAELDDLGNFVWLSRLDEQVKVLGHRVELSEIEIALTVPELVNEIVCAFDRETDRIFAFFTTSSLKSDAIIERELREVCGISLPAYMHPHFFCHIESIPLSKNGKTDRSELLRRAR